MLFTRSANDVIAKLTLILRGHVAIIMKLSPHIGTRSSADFSPRLRGKGEVVKPGMTEIETEMEMEMGMKMEMEIHSPPTRSAVVACSTSALEVAASF